MAANDGNENGRSPPAAAVSDAFRRAARITAPSAAAAAAAASMALADAGPVVLALGVAVGAAFGAGVAAFIEIYRAAPATAAGPFPRDMPPPPEREDAAATALAIGGPSVGEKDALIDAHTILQAAPLALLLLDERGLVAFANPAAEAETGKKLVGVHFTAILRAPVLVDAVRDAYAGAAPTPVAFTLRGAQERHLRALVTSLNAEEAAGHPTAAPRPIRGHGRVLLLLQDETRVRRAEQLHRDFVANASHELKTPLASLGGFIETLRGPAKDDPIASERFLAIMAQQAERMRRLVEDLLSLNRIELNEHIAPRTPLNVVDVVRRAVSEAGEAAQERIKTQFPSTPQMAFGDAVQLQQSFANLIENALKYGRDAGAIRVSVDVRAEPKPRIGVSVEDDGAGIAKEHLPRLTERFYRVAEGPKTGTGLGLSIVKHAVSRHRGDLEIDSRPGRGSKFTIWLPAIGTADAGSSAPEPEQSPPSATADPLS